MFKSITNFFLGKPSSTEKMANESISSSQEMAESGAGCLLTMVCMMINLLLCIVQVFVFVYKYDTFFITFFINQTTSLTLTFEFKYHFNNKIVCFIIS